MLTLLRKKPQRQTPSNARDAAVRLKYGLPTGNPYLLGMAGMLDLAGILQRETVERLAHRDTWRALQSDWAAIGGDLWSAIEREREQQGGSHKPL
jgi:hypothetical protein